MKLSIAIPAYECFGRGVEFIDFQIKKFESQTFKDFEVIISDNSQDNVIEQFLNGLETKLNIKYFRNNNLIKNSSTNTNNCIKNCNGEFIKFIFQDDFLLNEKSLEITTSALDNDVQWLVSCSEQILNNGRNFEKFFPYFNYERLYYGENTIGAPTALTIKNNKNKNIFFDENLITYMDIDYYLMLYEKYGEPRIINEPTVSHRIWSNQLSKITSNDEKAQEFKIMRKKHEK